MLFQRVEAQFRRDSRERTSTSSWAGRVRDLHRDVKKKISRLRNSKGTLQDEDVRISHCFIKLRGIKEKDTVFLSKCCHF